MDPKTLDLLKRLGLLSTDQLAALGNLSTLADADLNAMENDLRDHFDRQRGQEVSVENVAALQGLHDGIAAVRSERDRRPDLATVAASLVSTVAETPRPPRPARPALGSLTRRAAAPLPASSRIAGSVTTPAGRAITDAAELGEAMRLAVQASMTGPPTEGRTLVATATVELPDDRTLGADPDRNGQLIASAGQSALVAAGGLCAPVDVRYDLVVDAVNDRPVRDGLVAFGAPRGGVRWMDSPQITDFAAGISAWTAATDANPGAATKPCLAVACGQPREVVTDAIVLCLRFGNFSARFHPEAATANTELALAAHARFAEARLLANIDAGSTAITTPRLLGATRDYFGWLDAIGQNVRTRRRLAPEAALRVILPEWFRAMLRADLTRSLAHDPAQMTVTNAAIEAMFAARNVRVTWTLDSQIPGAQAAGAAAGFAATMVWRIFPEGTWLYLDAGELNLGVIRDAALTSTNDYKTFTETFEQVAKVGGESYRVTSTLCADGSSAATLASAALCAP